MSDKVIKLFNMSKTSKMPCHSFSLPASECKTGSVLAEIKGSVCHGCYARKGYYSFPNVKAPRFANLAGVQTVNFTGWVETMTNLIKTKEKSGFFRWHDSGDLQSEEHLDAIVRVARNLPEIKFWLPTKEKAMIKHYKGIIPDNLVIRLSSAMIDQEPSKTWKLTSTVHSAGAGHQFGVECLAYTRDGQCGTCRACWDSKIANISYPKH